MDIVINRYDQGTTIYKNVQAGFVPILEVLSSSNGSSWGDLNNDGSQNILDIVLLVNIILDDL